MLQKRGNEAWQNRVMKDMGIILHTIQNSMTTTYWTYIQFRNTVIQIPRVMVDIIRAHPQLLLMSTIYYYGTKQVNTQHMALREQTEALRKQGRERKEQSKQTASKGCRSNLTEKQLEVLRLISEGRKGPQAKQSKKRLEVFRK